ncbi:hypothetical protein [Acrocarpospora corrugata]|nr:hypothetical protein [Acrocarpospora corrugata]
MAQIHYLHGDATCPQAEGPKVIAHICHDQGGWGKGFVLAVSRRWPEPEAAYRRWYQDHVVLGSQTDDLVDGGAG